MRATRPTRRQKQVIDGLRLTVENYLVVSETAAAITLYNKATGKTITRYKKERKI
ncbi:MAG: hypothetical protein NC253_16220 [Ruminococcus sp.]|nr:hypothetical protein [Ruminococcus sp.]